MGCMAENEQLREQVGLPYSYSYYAVLLLDILGQGAEMEKLENLKLLHENPNRYNRLFFYNVSGYFGV